MAKHKPAWLSFLPPGVPLSKLSLDEVRAVKDAHALLTESVEGPECFVDCTRGFRLLLLFGIDCVADDTYPPLTRCWVELERLFMGDPGFEDGVFVQSWILMDFPFGPEGQTALDYFEDFLKGTDAATGLQRFIEAARGSRLGLHQDIMRTKSVAKFRELLSGKVTSAVPTVDEYEKGEILLARVMNYGERAFIFGDPKGFPKETKTQIEDMVRRKLFYFDDQKTPEAQFETFMKLAGPYWMSCVTKNDDVDILNPDHYRTYLDRPVAKVNTSLGKLGSPPTKPTPKPPSVSARPNKKRTSAKSVGSLPETHEAWLQEVAAAYADAHEAIPFGPLVGTNVGEGSLFHMAPEVCLKFRGIKRTPRKVKTATEAALASFVVMQDREPELLARPHVAFAFCYLAAHFGLGLVGEDELGATMDFIVREQKTLDRLIKKTIKTGERGTTPAIH